MRIDVDSADDLVVWHFGDWDTRISLFLLDSFHWSYTGTYPDLLKACMSPMYWVSTMFEILSVKMNNSKQDEANILCSSLLNNIRRVSIYRINPQITTHSHISLPPQFSRIPWNRLISRVVRPSSSKARKIDVSTSSKSQGIRLQVLATFGPWWCAFP